MEETVDSTRQWCFGCGEKNPEGLQIAFRLDGRRAVGEFMPRRLHQGFPGVAHGGVAAAVLDEAMGWAMYATGTWALTAKIEVRYRGPLRPGELVVVTGEVTSSRGRWLEAKGDIRTTEGELLAEAKGLFVEVPREQIGKLETFYLDADRGRQADA